MIINKWIVCIVVFMLAVVGCKKEEERKVDNSDFPGTDRGDIQVEDFYMVFWEHDTLPKDTFYNHYSNSQPADTIKLKENVSYEAKIHFLDKNGKEVSGDIQNNGEDYIVCYFPDNSKILKLDHVSKDVNDKNLGILTAWTADDKTNPNKANNLNVTLNYQRLTKDGFCDPGIRLIDANFVYSIN